MAKEIEPGSGGGIVLGSGVIDGSGNVEELGAAIDSASPGAVMNLKLSLPVPFPEWIGPWNVLASIADAIRPHVSRLIEVRTDGNDLLVRWRA